MKDLRIVFMGTPGFAVGVLRALVENHANVVGVITAPDKPAGRGRKLKASAVKEYALERGLKIVQPTNLKNEDFLTELAEWDANLQIIVAFRMLPKLVWAMPKYGTFNLHASLLPQYRGAAPINWAIMNGEKKTGVTTFFIDEKIDTGAILFASEVAIETRETVGSLHDKLMTEGSDLVLKTVLAISEGTAIPKAQPMTSALKEAPKLNASNTRIDWNQDPEPIDAFIRGLSPYPAAWTELHYEDDTLKVKIYATDFVNECHEDQIGSMTTSKKELKVAVRNGYIFIKELQMPGKRKMDIISLLNGFDFGSNSKMM
jgi:methionyl-tRNA formyltransferase